MRIVILYPAAIGDTLLSFPVIKALRAQYTDVHLTFIGNPAILSLAQAWGLAEEVYDADQLPWGEVTSADGMRSSVLLQLFQEADLAIYWLWFSDTVALARQNMLAAGAKEVIAAHGFPDLKTAKHWTEYLEESVGLHNVEAEWISPVEQMIMNSASTISPIAIHTGSTFKDRIWPAASFATVIKRLLKLQQPVLLLAGPADAKQLQRVRRHLFFTHQSGLLSVLHNAPIVEVAQCIAQCKCYLGNDSGIAHLAALLGVPTIALFLTHNVVRTHPLGPAVEVIQDEQLERISVERVFASIQRYL